MNTIAPALSYGSVCSGIEAVTVAWQRHGFKPAWFSEIDPFANAVLSHHYPHIPNHGDMRGLAAKIVSGEICAPDILVGGTPCQAFSVAGLRNGLSDPRGALTLKYAELANVIDQTRELEKKPPAVLVWENVPGVLSDRANAFGCFLGAIAGEDCELQPPGQKWTNAGCVYGPQRSVAWRILDAQYFGVAQRRRRVFVVASGRTGLDPGAVLFESGSVRRDSPPGSQAREDLASSVAASIPPAVEGRNREAQKSSYGETTLSVCFGGGNTRGPIDRAACLTARGHKCDFELETFAVHAINGDLSHTLTGAYSVTENGNGRGVPVVGVSVPATFQVASLMGAVSHALNSANNGKGSSEDGTGRGVPIVAVHYQFQDGTWTTHHPPTCFAIAENSRGELRVEGGDGRLCGALSTGGGKPGQGQPAVLSVALRGRDSGYTAELGGDVACALRASSGGGDKGHLVAPSINADFKCIPITDGSQDGGWTTWRVRRLMPLECERLQGLPDDYSLVLYRGKPATDGPRYKAIGNSMAVPCMAWIGRRLAHAIGFLCYQSG